MDTLDDIKADEFRTLIKNTDLTPRFTDGNYSLFVPTDYAMNMYNEKINEMVRTINLIIIKIDNYQGTWQQLTEKHD